MTKALTKAVRLRSNPDLGNPNSALLPVQSNQSLIQWPTEPEVQKVSEQLAQIRRLGIRLEADGDYFKSGDLAYQIQEIIRATEQLIKKSQRAKS